ncbi:heat shock cognate 71 kDa protein-like isoform X1 [Ptychodera flava]|uniref:heat shock cognate 71 kDa protein-like isoform X1 n=1 Tax=Ptychodera flava TaxID=63121 RepID=UPI00396A986A
MIDLGGGSLNVSIVNVDDGIFEVKSVSGDVHLGGEDFINNLVSHFVQEFEEKHGKSIRNDLHAVTRLRSACESAMCKLSSASATMASVEINSLTEDINFCSSVTRDLFEELNAKLFQRILNVIKKAMHNAKVTQSKLDEIIVIGGASHIPKVQTMFKEYFDETNVKMNVNPDQAVACGAAIQAAILCNDKSDSLQDILLVDATPMTLGIEAVHGVMAPIIKRNTNIPIKKCQKFTTFVENPAVLVPDCQAELIQKQRQEYEHNCHAHDTSKAPLSRKPLNIQIKIYEGDNVQTSDNNLLCKFTLPNLPHAPSGVPKIAVTFDIPASDSVLHVSAVHENSSTSNTVTVGNCSSKLCFVLLFKKS